MVCFFHYSQAIWKNMIKNGLGGKGTYLKNHELLLNLQCLCFIKKENIDNMFNKIKRKCKNENCKNFFHIFQGLGWGVEYLKYSGIIMIY